MDSSIDIYRNSIENYSIDIHFMTQNTPFGSPLGTNTKSQANRFSGGLPKNKNKKNSSCEFLLLFAFWDIKTYRKTINKKSIGVYSTVQVIRGISLKMIKIIITGQSKA